MRRKRNYSKGMCELHTQPVLVVTTLDEIVSTTSITDWKEKYVCWAFMGRLPDQFLQIIEFSRFSIRYKSILRLSVIRNVLQLL